jgi:hypothetical protein
MHRCALCLECFERSLIVPSLSECGYGCELNEGCSVLRHEWHSKVAEVYMA